MPVGPKLVRGRGLAKRRPRAFLGGVAGFLLLLLLAMGLVLLALRSL